MSFDICVGLVWSGTWGRVFRDRAKLCSFLSGKTFRHSGDITSYMDVHVVHVANTFFSFTFSIFILSLSVLLCLFISWSSQLPRRVGVLLIADSGDPGMARSEKIVT